MTDWRDNDYTRNRNTGKIPYEIEDKIGRKDPTYVTAVDTTPTTASGTGIILKSNYR